MNRLLFSKLINKYNKFNFCTLSKNSNYETFYLLQEREFIKSNEPIYKIGKTSKTMLTRLKGYPKNSNVFYSNIVDKKYNIESNIKKKFIKEFIQRKDIGSEYFEGSIIDMINIINKIVYKHI